MFDTGKIGVDILQRDAEVEITGIQGRAEKERRVRHTPHPLGEKRDTNAECEDIFLAEDIIVLPDIRVESVYG